MNDERTLAVYGLAEDLQIAGSSWEVLMQLQRMNGGTSSLKRLAADFLWFSMRSMRDNAVLHLWKAYDTEPSARSLSWFIRTHSVQDVGAKSSDLDILSVKNDLVKCLAVLRHQVIAHRGKGSNQKGSNLMISQNNISDGFPSLVQSALAILERHHGSNIPRRIPYTSAAAVRQLCELDVYLDDAYRGFTGIERSVREIDGDVRAGSKPR